MVGMVGGIDSLSTETGTVIYRRSLCGATIAGSGFDPLTFGLPDQGVSESGGVRLFFGPKKKGQRGCGAKFHEDMSFLAYTGSLRASQRHDRRQGYTYAPLDLRPISVAALPTFYPLPQLRPKNRGKSPPGANGGIGECGAYLENPSPSPGEIKSPFICRKPIPTKGFNNVV